MLRKGCKDLGVLAASAAILVFLVSLPLQAEAQPRDVKESVMHSMTNYPKIKSFQEYRESSVYDIDRARSGWFPRLDARAGYGPRIYSDEGNRTTNRDDVWDMRSDAELVLSQTCGTAGPPKAATTWPKSATAPLTAACSTTPRPLPWTPCWRTSKCCG